MLWTGYMQDFLGIRAYEQDFFGVFVVPSVANKQDCH